MRLAPVAFALALLPAIASAKVDFRKDILPLLDSKCVKCHQEERQEKGRTVKPKAGLRLDAARAILNGTREGAVVFKGQPARSTLYTRVTLPADHDDVMPPEGKGKPLTKQQQQTIKTWIEEGADFGGWKGNESGLGKPKTRKPTKTNTPNKLSTRLGEPDTAAIEALEKSGAIVTPVEPNSNLLKVEWPTGARTVTDSSLPALLALGSNITDLNIAKTGITDAGLEQIGAFPRLTRLNLHSTKVTDAGIAKLGELKHLNYLNLFDTKVTDKSLPLIKDLRKLEAVYLWKTKVTESGVAKLKRALPDARIVLD